MANRNGSEYDSVYDLLIFLMALIAAAASIANLYMNYQIHKHLP